MTNRIFSRTDEGAFEEGTYYISVPSEKIEKVYNLYGYYEKNPNYAPELYDPEDETTYPFIEWGEEWHTGSDIEIYEKGDDGEFYLVESGDLYHEEEAEQYFDGSNWAKEILTSENGYCQYTEETEKFEEGYFESLHSLLTEKASPGCETEFLFDKKGRFWKRHISHWQGSYRNSYEEISEVECLAGILPHISVSIEDKEHFPTIKGMKAPAAICVSPESEYHSPEYEIIDIYEKVQVEGTNDAACTRGSTVYALPDGRQIQLFWSRWQGETDRWEIYEN